MSRTIRTLGIILCLLIISVAGVSAETDPAAVAPIVEAIDKYVEPYIGQDALTNYDGKASSCHAFVNHVWKNVFGYDLYQNRHIKTPESTDFSAEAIGAYIRQYARPGDILRVDRNTHSLVITAINEEAVTGYDWLNRSAKPPYIAKRSYTWQQVADWRKWAGSGEIYFLYQIKDDIYNSFAGESETRSSVKTTSAIADPLEVVAPLVAVTSPVNRGNISRSNIMILQVDQPEMTVNGLRMPIDEQGTKPLIMNSRTLLPLRAVIERMGGTLHWDDSTKTVTIVKGLIKIKLTINDPVIQINGQPLTLDTKPIIVNSRTLLPIRPVAEALGAQVHWEGVNKTVTVNY